MKEKASPWRKLFVLVREYTILLIYMCRMNIVSLVFFFWGGVRLGAVDWLPFQLIRKANTSLDSGSRVKRVLPSIFSRPTFVHSDLGSDVGGSNVSGLKWQFIFSLNKTGYLRLRKEAGQIIIPPGWSAAIYPPTLLVNCSHMWRD